MPVLGGARMVTPATSSGALYSSRLWLGESTNVSPATSRLATLAFTRLGRAQPALAQGHQAAPWPSTRPAPSSATSAPASERHAVGDLPQARVSLEKRSVPSMRSAVPRALGGMASAKDRNVPLEGSRMVPPAAVEHCVMARCSAAVSSVTPSPAAPASKALHVRAPMAMATERPRSSYPAPPGSATARSSGAPAPAPATAASSTSARVTAARCAYAILIRLALPRCLCQWRAVSAGCEARHLPLAVVNCHSLPRRQAGVLGQPSCRPTASC